MAGLHYASGGGIASSGEFEAGAAGFNLADVQSVDQLNALPQGVQGLVWLDQSDGATTSFKEAVTPYIGNPKLYGFYLVDEPDPTGQWGRLVAADDLKAESDWIHDNVPGAKTFITMMDMGSSQHSDFTNTYNPENTHIDLFGLDPYPVRSETSSIDFGMIDRAVAAAVDSGIPLANIVPVYQAFGGGGWVNDGGGSYVVPTAAEEQQLIDHWQELVPAPAFDYAYSWISQNGDTALENRPDLQSVFLSHNTAPASDGAQLALDVTPETVVAPLSAADNPTVASDVPGEAVQVQAGTSGAGVTATSLDFSALLTGPEAGVTPSNPPPPADLAVVAAPATPAAAEPAADVIASRDYAGHHYGHHHHAWD
jgi:hypothetical protein